MSNTSHRNRADQINLSPSRTSGGVSAETAAIPAVDPPADRRRDKAAENIKDSPTAPLAHVSRRGLIMNSIVSAAAVATATAIPSQSIIAAPADRTAVSFPDLVARFIRIRERENAYTESSNAYFRKIDQLFFEATGISTDERLAVDWKSEPERFQQLDAVLSRIFKENPNENDPTDKNGCSTAWPLIQDELNAVAFAMLNRPPQSLTDLAWQTEALLLADPELRQGDNAEHPMLPKFFENVRVLAGPLAIPNVVPPIKPDPIFAAIEAHRKAVVEYNDCITEHSRLEQELPEDRRQSSVTAHGEDIVETDDPRWIAAEFAVSEKHDAADDAAYRLLEVSPTTLGGASALLKYFTEADVDGFLFPEKADPEETNPFGRRFAHGLTSHVADALAKIRA